jgi:proteasome-associated ATPase
MSNDPAVLQSAILEYQQMMSDIISQEDMIVARVIAGPFRMDDTGIQYFRVGDEASSRIVNFSPLWRSAKINEVQHGTDVVLVKGSIVGVLPKELEVSKKDTAIQLAKWEDIGGLRSQLKDIREAVEVPLKYAELAADLGLAPMNGILLYGRPGNGKTLIAKAIAGTILGTTNVDKQAFTYVKGAELLSRYVGDAEHNITRMFADARQYAVAHGKRAVIFIDEAEAILPARGSRISSDVDATIVPTFLSEMSGMYDKNINPIVILATNKPEDLDDAILREGRLDLKIHVAPPPHTDFVEIVCIHLKKVKCIDAAHDIATHAADLIFDQMPARVSGAMAETVVTLATQKAMTRIIGEKTSVSKSGLMKCDVVEAVELLKIK